MPETVTTATINTRVLGSGLDIAWWLRSASADLRAAHQRTTASVLDGLAVQIEAQVKPKPEEPTGLGAVIVDRSGNHWIRQPHLTHLPWTSVETPALWFDYCELDVAEVLFPGVTL